MKYLLYSLICLLCLTAVPAVAQALEQPERHGHKGDCADEGPGWCKSRESTCNPEMRGRCGKRRGDWYGAPQPVVSALEAQRLLQNYFEAPDYSVSGITEQKWGFRAEILDKNGKIIDKVMIDKRSGRIRSVY